MLEQRIYEMLTLRLMTYEDLAKASNLTNNNLKYLIRHEERLRLSTLKRISKALGCTVGWLLRDRI